MDSSNHADASLASYQRSSPFVIVSYLFQGLTVSGLGKVFGLLAKGSVGSILALVVIIPLQTIGVHWFIRLLVVCFCILVVQLVISVFKYFTLQFRSDDNKISAKKGFFRQHILDFDWFNVRSIVLTRSVLQRRINFASISLVTAGSSENSIEIPYIPYSLALEWERRVIEQDSQIDNRGVEGAGKDSTSFDDKIRDEEPSKLIHKLNPRKLVHASFAGGNVLFDALFGFLVVGLGYCVYRFFYQILIRTPNIFELNENHPLQLFRGQVSATLRDLPMNFRTDTTSLIEAFQQTTGLAIAQSLQGRIFFFTSLSLIIVIVFYVINRIRYVLGNYDFELTQQGIHLQAEDGLMKKRRLTIRRDRVQTTSFRANFVERSLNRGTVQLDSASKIDCSIPFVTTECADRILSTVIDEKCAPVTMSPFSQQFTPIHVLSLIQKLVVWVLLPLVLIAPFFPEATGHVWPYVLILVVFAVAKICIGWRRRGYIINDDFLLQKEGGFSWWSVKVAPLYKVQSTLIKQSWIQHMRDRATISFSFASSNQSIPFLDRPDAEAMQRMVEDRIRDDSDSPDEIIETETFEEWKSLPQKYIVSCVIGKLITSIFVIVPLFLLFAWAVHSWFSVAYEQLGWSLGLVLGIWVAWRVVSACLKIPKCRYAYGKHDLVVKESFLAKQTETVRYSRLQSIATRNGFVDGLFRLSSLILYTAEDRVSIRGLDREEAASIRDYIAARMVEISSIGTDALTMSEQGTHSADSAVAETSLEAATISVDQTDESEEFRWRKFSGWTQEIVKRVLVILLGIPWLLFVSFLFVFALTESGAIEYEGNTFYFLTNGYLYLGIWCILSLWTGSRPFIEIPRKRYLVTAKALRYKQGWLYRSHHFVPLSRIQNVSVSATFLSRIFKNRSIKISTASDAELTLDYLSAGEAEALRAKLQTG